MTQVPPEPRITAAQQQAHQRAAYYRDLIRSAAAQAGGQIAGDDGASVAHEVKSMKSLRDKTERRDRFVGDPDASLLEVNDLNRYTVLFDRQDYTPGVERMCELLAESGLIFDPDYSHNSWDDPLYRGYNTTFRDPDRPHAALDPETAGADHPRHPIEVQFHTPESFTAKTETHDLYELRRSGRLNDQERAGARYLQAQVNARVSPPLDNERLGPRVAGRPMPEGAPAAAIAAAQAKAAQLRAERERAEQEQEYGGLTEGAEFAGPPAGSSRGPPELPPAQRQWMAQNLDRDAPGGTDRGDPDRGRSARRGGAER